MEDFIFILKRKIFHIFTVIYIMLYYLLDKYFGQRDALFSLILILIFLAFLEFLQMKYRFRIPFFSQLYRENEKKTFSGSIYLLVGMIISFAVFDFPIAAAASLMMIFGDSASALVGRLGNHRMDHIKVSWEGIIAEFAVDIAAGFIFLNNIPVILAMAFCATTVETLLVSVDDNLAVPLVAGFAGQSLLFLMRIFNVG